MDRGGRWTFENVDGGGRMDRWTKTRPWRPAADLVINSEPDTDKLIQNVNSNLGYRYTRTEECNNPCCMQWSPWTQDDCRKV